jgi:hypothetical protein
MVLQIGSVTNKIECAVGGFGKRVDVGDTVISSFFKK